MIQARTMHFLADDHRQGLIADAASGRVASGSTTHKVEHHKSTTSATQRSAAGIPVTGGRAVRRAVAPRFGAWLIEFGTRLGGATIRTS